MRYREEKTALPADRLFYYAVIFTLLIFSESHAQVPINGFCRYREFKVKTGFKNLSAVDFNSDGYRDLLVYNSENNRYISLQSDPQSNFGKISEKYSSLHITDIHPLGNEVTGRRYLVESRNTREVSLASFSKNGTLNLSARVKFTGYPSGIDAADTDGDGRAEGLVSGSALDGLYLLRESNRSLKEKKISGGKIFSWSGFIDLDYDSFFDIAAIDQISNSIVFFRNDRAGNFFESRSIKLDGEISECKNADFNSDGFTDFVFIRGDRFEILLGDSVSSFSKKIFLDTPVKPDKFVLLDFNSDGFNDIAFINEKSGELYLLFARNSKSFYPPILYLKKNGLVNLTAYIDRTGKKIAALSSDGLIYFVNTLGLNDTSFMITLGAGQSAIQTFDYMNDKYKDFCFIDEESQSLKVVLSERRRLFRTYFSIPLSRPHSSITVDEINPRIKTFYCYSKERRLIEAVRVNLDNGIYSRLVLYADNRIEDFKLETDRLKDWQKISVLIKNGRDLYLQIIEIRDFRKAASNAYPVAENADDGRIAPNIYRDIYTFSRNAEKIELTKSVFNKKIIERRTLLSLKVSSSDKVNFDMTCIDEPVLRVKPVASVITINNNSTFYYFLNNKSIVLPLKFKASESQGLCYAFEEGSEDPVFYYKISGNSKICRIAPRGMKTQLIDPGPIESESINNYLIAGINMGRIFLVRPDYLHKTISFEKL